MSTKPRLIALSIDAIPVGSPLKFALRSSQGILLAQRGFVVANRELLEKISERNDGLAVDIQESPMVHRAYRMRLHQMVIDNKDILEISQAKIEDEEDPAFAPSTVHGGYPDFWSYQLRANHLLRNPEAPTFIAKVEKMQRELTYFSKTFPDVSLTAVIHLAANEMKHYSAMHALLVWVVVTHTARFALRWDEEVIDALGKAALTMNISMTELQDQLAMQSEPLTVEQQAIVLQHPAMSKLCLYELGVRDPLWLEAVAQHRDQEPGPLSSRVMARQMGRLIQRADVFGARLAPRLHRQPMHITAAMQASYLDEMQQPDEAGTAIVRTLGIYAPGSYVRLANGEVGIVVRRQLSRPGVMGKDPYVMVVLNKEGYPVSSALDRDTGTAMYKIVGAVQARDIKVTMSIEKLLKAADKR